MRRFTSASVLLFALLSRSVAAVADAIPYAQYFEALQARELYIVAEEFGLSRLSESDLTDDERCHLSIETAKTLTMHGDSSLDESREELWGRAELVLDSQLKHADTPRHQILLEAWKKLLIVQQSLTLAFEAEYQPELQSLRVQVVEQITPALDSLRRICLELEGPTRAKFELTPKERSELLQLIYFHCGRGELAVAELEVSESARIARLKTADSDFDHISSGSAPPELKRKVAVLQARVARLLGDGKRADSALDRAIAGKPTTIEVDAALSERIAIRISQDDFEEALQLIVGRLKDPTPLTDQFRVGAIEVFIRALQTKIPKDATAIREQYTSKIHEFVEQTRGKWRPRAVLKAERYQQEQKLGPELAATLRKAAAAWSENKFDESIQLYSAASMLAQQSNLPNEAVDNAMTVAAILIELKRWQPAQVELERIITAFPNHPRAAEADLLRCYAIGRAAGENPYRESLQNHLRNYSNSSTTADASWMLALLDEQQGRLESSLESYRRIPVDHVRKQSANLQLTRILDRLYNQHDISIEKREELNSQVLSDVASISRPLLFPQIQLEPVQAEALLNCAKLILQHPQHLTSQADQMLAAIENSLKNEQQTANDAGSNISPEWQSIKQKMIELKIVSFTMQHKLPEARDLLRTLSQSDPTALLAVLNRLTDLSGSIGQDFQYELGAVQRATVQELNEFRGNLTIDQRSQLDMAGIYASIAMKDWTDAVRRCETIYVNDSKNHELIRLYLRVLTSRGEKEDFALALTLWQKLEHSEPKGSEQWIEARLSIAEIRHQQGDSASAKKMLGVTRTLYPRMGTPALKNRSDELWSQLKSEPAN
ncbi:hypothetical protein SH668x_002736 [Planctomicrobium sp. SH668]|uniref:hypothetical protein n=1 Tax=Planctomicrobium sp. SH668 TaxID=3448126 RepID=UPI003F5BCE59